MADKLLRSIKFPTLPDRYVIGDSTLTEEGAAADAKAVGDALATKADTKGRYEDLIVGGAEQLMADGYESDTEPYLFRPTGGSADVGNREYLDKIVGGTVAWNQLVNQSSLPSTTAINGVTFTNNEDGSITVNGTATKPTRLDGIVNSKTWVAHKYLLIGCPAGGSHETYSIALRGAGWDMSDEGSGVLWDASVNPYKGIVIYINPDFTVSNLQFKPQFFDLTAMFGTTIADAIYSLERATAGAGVAWFRQYFPEDYYPYDPGTLRSVEGVSAHETVGFNQYNPTTGTARLLGGHQYQITGTYTATSLDGTAITPDSDGLFTPTSNGVLTVTGGNSTDTCVHLVLSGTRNGEYEPYTKHTYPLDSSLTLRGVPKLADGKLSYDGDVYPPSGEVQRRYGLRAYQSGDESLADAITDGTNTVYKLATPTTETAEGYEQYQMCDPNGTEAFVTDSIVPVGHETRYPHDLKKKIETAPDSPSTDGTYLMKRSGGKNAYMALPSTPSANGSYVLTLTVSGGNASYSWTAKG